MDIEKYKTRNVHRKKRYCLYIIFYCYVDGCKTSSGNGRLLEIFRKHNIIFIVNLQPTTGVYLFVNHFVCVFVSGKHSNIIVPPSWIVKLPRKGNFKSSIRSPKKRSSKKKTKDKVRVRIL